MFLLRKRPQRGFTAFEMFVGAIIFLVILTMVYRLFAFTRNPQVAGKRVEQNQMIRELVFRIYRELAQARYLYNPPLYGKTFGSGMKLEFHDRNYNKITYLIEEGEWSQGGNKLVRVEGDSPKGRIMADHVVLVKDNEPKTVFHHQGKQLMKLNIAVYRPGKTEEESKVFEAEMLVHMCMLFNQ